MRLLLGYLSDLRCEEVGAGATALQSEESPALSSFKGKKKSQQQSPCSVLPSQRKMKGISRRT